jgi:hypothetical protein
MADRKAVFNGVKLSIEKICGERARLHYDLFAISKVLPTVPRIRFSCIFCTWFPLRRSEDTPVEHPGREPGSTGQGGHSIRWVTFHP